jgi:hypothetical protein
MKRYIRFGLLAFAIVAMAGCSTSMWQTYIHNDAAGLCDSPQTVLGAIPSLIPTNDEMAGVNAFCTGVFGTAPAPTPALGNNPVFPSATPSAAASPSVTK